MNAICMVGKQLWQLLSINILMQKSGEHVLLWVVERWSRSNMKQRRPAQAKTHCGDFSSSTVTSLNLFVMIALETICFDGFCHELWSLSTPNGGGQRHARVVQ